MKILIVGEKGLGMFKMLKEGLFLAITSEKTPILIGPTLLKPTELRNTKAFDKKINGRKTAQRNRVLTLSSKKGHFICKR